MSEFGSSKSFSSVSESSASSGSQPPSSSDEVHTCHRCGNCCYSDKSRLSISNKPPLDEGAAGVFGPAHAAWNALDLTNIPFTAEGVHGCGFEVISPVFRHDGTDYRLVVSGRAMEAILQSWSVIGFDESGPIYGWADQFGIVWASNPVTDCCGGSAQAYLLQADADPQPHAHEWGHTVENNPCCWDTIGVGCFQHFGGDCRGNCDEEPSSKSSASSSEENPLP